MGGCLSSLDYTLVTSADDLIEFDKMGFTAMQLRRLFGYFREIDEDSNGFLSSEECFLSLFEDLPKTAFVQRVLKMMYKRGKDQIMFADFVRALWNYCTSDHEALCQFAFELYQVDDGDGFLGVDEIIHLLNELYGGTEKLAQNTSALKCKADMLALANSTEDGCVDYNQFATFSKKHQSLLFPAFSLQHSMQEKILGVRYWKGVSKRRRLKERGKGSDRTLGIPSHWVRWAKRRRERLLARHLKRKQVVETRLEMEEVAESEGGSGGGGVNELASEEGAGDLGKVALRIGRTNYRDDFGSELEEGDGTSFYDVRSEAVVLTQKKMAERQQQQEREAAEAAAVAAAEVAEKLSATQERIRTRSLKRQSLIRRRGSDGMGSNFESTSTEGFEPGVDASGTLGLSSRRRSSYQPSQPYATPATSAAAAVSNDELLVRQRYVSPEARIGGSMSYSSESQGAGSRVRSSRMRRASAVPLGGGAVDALGAQGGTVVPGGGGLRVRRSSQQDPQQPSSEDLGAGSRVRSSRTRRASAVPLGGGAVDALRAQGGTAVPGGGGLRVRRSSQQDPRVPRRSSLSQRSEGQRSRVQSSRSPLLPGGRRVPAVDSSTAGRRSEVGSGVGNDSSNVVEPEAAADAGAATEITSRIRARRSSALSAAGVPKRSRRTSTTTGMPQVSNGTPNTNKGVDLRSRRTSVGDPVANNRRRV